MFRAIMLFAFLSFTFAIAPESQAFEKLGISWCDKLLSRYDTCLRGVTYQRCEQLTKRGVLARRYAGGRYAYKGRTYGAPAAACVAEVNDLIAEMQVNIKFGRAIMRSQRDRTKFCSGTKSNVIKVMRWFGCR